MSSDDFWKKKGPQTGDPNHSKTLTPSKPPLLPMSQCPPDESNGARAAPWTEQNFCSSRRVDPASVTKNGRPKPKKRAFEHGVAQFTSLLKGG